MDNKWNTVSRLRRLLELVCTGLFGTSLGPKQTASFALSQLFSHQCWRPDAALSGDFYMITKHNETPLGHHSFPPPLLRHYRPSTVEAQFPLGFCDGSLHVDKVMYYLLISWRILEGGIICAWYQYIGIEKSIRIGCCVDTVVLHVRF